MNDNNKYCERILKFMDLFEELIFNLTDKEIMESIDKSFMSEIYRFNEIIKKNIDIIPNFEIMVLSAFGIKNLNI